MNIQAIREHDVVVFYPSSVPYPGLAPINALITATGASKVRGAIPAFCRRFQYLRKVWGQDLILLPVQYCPLSPQQGVEVFITGCLREVAHPDEALSAAKEFAAQCEQVLGFLPMPTPSSRIKVIPLLHH